MGIFLCPSYLYLPHCTLDFECVFFTLSNIKYSKTLDSRKYFQRSFDVKLFTCDVANERYQK